MRPFRFILFLLITIALILVLDRSWVVDGNRLPPPGRFFDPFHGYLANAEARDHLPSEEIQLEGLRQPVTVVYDSLFIPHIFAQNDEDLYRMQGYITARHRLWQMEFQVFAAMGRISEIIGDAALDYDRGQRRIGMTYGAEHALRVIEQDPQWLNLLSAYTAGVNAYINQLSYEDLPLEYKLIDYWPEPWTNLKSAAVIMNLNRTLSFSEKDVEMTNALRLFGKELVDLLYPDFENVGDPIVNSPESWKFPPVSIDSFPPAVPEEFIGLLDRYRSDPKVGSNNWAVSGSKSATGSPILANDMHLDLSLPSLWFIVHLNAPGVNVMGVSTPGGPGVVVGFNDSIAWGFTNAQRDLVDWYRITFDGDDTDRYLLDSVWVESEYRIETIEVRDGEAFTDSVIYTRWGPVVFDSRYHNTDDHKNFALKWIAHEAENEFAFIYKLNRAKNYTDYLHALDAHFSPAQNVAFASRSDSIAIKVQGQFPVRRQNEGKFVLDGSKTSSGWQAFIPFDQNPLLLNPERGFVSSANQYPVDETYPYYITASNYEAYRNRRINQVLSGVSLISIQDMMDLQNDNLNLMASESLPVFLRMLNMDELSEKETEVVRELRLWNYFNDAESKAAVYYEAWWQAFYRMTWDEMNRSDVSLQFPTEYVTIRFLRESPEFTFFDLQSTPEKETAVEIVRSAFAEAMNTVTEWEEQNGTEATWGRYKNTVIRHLARIEQFSRSVNNGGNESIVNATRRGNGPSWRQVVSLEASGVRAFGAYPGGQSGNPGSMFYDNLIRYWESGTYVELSFPASAAELLPDALFHSEYKPR